MRQFIKKILRLFGYEIVKLPKKANRPQPDKFSYQSKYIDFAIKPVDRVLDIGSGGQPFPLATHLCDLRLETNQDRPYDPIKIDSRPFFLTDILQLPCVDKQFDFVYCCHVLEHVQDPIACCKEIQRIAQRGYIETPTLGKDMLFGWARGLHKWHVTNHGNTLIFFEYSDRLLDGCRTSYWKNHVLNNKYHPLQDIFYDNLDSFNVMFPWQGGFTVEVFHNEVRTPEIYDPFTK